MMKTGLHEICSYLKRSYLESILQVVMVIGIVMGMGIGIGIGIGMGMGMGMGMASTAVIGDMALIMIVSDNIIKTCVILTVNRPAIAHMCKHQGTRNQFGDHGPIGQRSNGSPFLEPYILWCR